MSLTLAVNEKNDLYIDKSGNIATASDIHACKESAQQAAQTQLGEIQYHTDRGIPNFSVIWSGSPSVAQFEAALRREIRRTTDVRDIPALSTSIVGNRVVYAATIKTSFGVTEINA